MRVAGHIDEQIAKNAIDQPWRNLIVVRPVQSVKGQLQLINRIRAGFVHAWRLTGRTDEDSGKQIRERRVVQPISNEALKQIGPAKEWAVGWCNPTERQMVAASCSGMPPVEHEFLGAEPR